MSGRPDQQAMADLFARHMDAELTGDLETTLEFSCDVQVSGVAGDLLLMPGDQLGLQLVEFGSGQQAGVK